MDIYSCIRFLISLVLCDVPMQSRSNSSAEAGFYKSFISLDGQPRDCTCKASNTELSPPFSIFNKNRCVFCGNKRICCLNIKKVNDRHSLSQFPASSERVTAVKTDIFVTSFGPVSDHDMVSNTLLPSGMLRIV